MITPPVKFASKQEYLRFYQRFRQLSQKPGARLSGLVSLTIFTIAFFIMFAILPTLQTIAQLNRQIADAKLVDTKLQQKLTALNRAEAEYLKLTPNLNLINDVVPGKANFDRLAWQINWLVNNLNLQITGGSFGEFFLKTTANDNQLTALPMELAVTGNYQQIKALVEQIVNLDRLITVDELAISNKKINLRNQAITASLKMTAYYLPSPL